MPVDTFFYPPGVCTDLNVNDQAQPLLVLAYVTDAFDEPVADGTEIEVTPVVDLAWGCHSDGGSPPTYSCEQDPGSSGLTFNPETRNGIAIIENSLGPFTSLVQIHWEPGPGAVTFPSTGCAPDPDLVGCILFGIDDGCVLDQDWIDGDPVLTGTPMESGEILWEWDPPASLDARVPLEYGISVSTGTPSANPANGMISGTSFLSTGLTDGVEYCARVQAFLAIADGGMASVPGSISNIACATPTAVPGGISVHILVPLRAP